VLSLVLVFETQDGDFSDEVEVTLQNMKVNESRYSPGVAQRVPGSLGSQIFMTFGT
jgi:hypothetical protein